MFWYVAGALAGGGALYGGVRYLTGHSASKHGLAAGKETQMTGPGQPLLPGTLALPVTQSVDGDALHTAARVALTALSSLTPTRAPVAGVMAFQVAYNLTNPPVKLKTDGIYGAKTQAALQSVIGSAVAPQAFVSHPGVKVGKPPIKAAPPKAVVPLAATESVPTQPLPGLGFTPKLDVAGAANVLAGLVAIPKTSDSRVSTFQAAYNLVPGVLQLAVDGKYGPSSQGALQSVLNWMGQGGVAPRNPFGGTVPSYTFPGLGSYVEA